MSGALKLYSELVRKLPSILRGNVSKPLESWVNQLHGQFPQPVINRALRLASSTKLPMIPSPGLKPVALSREQLLSRAQPLKLESKDLPRIAGETTQDDADQLMEHVTHVMSDNAEVQQELVENMAKAIQHDYPALYNSIVFDDVNRIVQAFFSEDLNTLPAKSKAAFQSYPEHDRKRIETLMGKQFYDFKDYLSENLIENPNLYGFQASKSNYRWPTTQRLFPEDVPGYFEQGLFASDPKYSYLKSPHISGASGILGHIRGIYSDPIEFRAHSNSLPLLNRNDGSRVPRTYLEEIQSDAGKIYGDSILHNVHGGLGKMALLDAMEKGPGAQLWIPNSEQIASVRGRKASSFAPIYEQELNRDFLGPLGRLFNLQPETKEGWRVLAPDESTRQRILAEGLPHLKAGGLACVHA